MIDYNTDYAFIIGVPVFILVGICLLVIIAKFLLRLNKRSTLSNQSNSGSCQQEEVEGDDKYLNHKNHTATYMELFAAKMARNNAKVKACAHGLRRDIAPHLLSPPCSSRSSSPAPDMTSPSSVLSSSSSISTPRVAKRLFGEDRSTDQQSSLSDSLSIDRSTSGAKVGISSPADLMEQAAIDPHVLIGCRIFVSGRGQGTVTGMKKKKFQSTKFRVIFDNNPNKVAVLKLRRRQGKSGEEFQVLPRHS